MAQAFPLQWPTGWPRSKRRERSRFDCSFTEARDGLWGEIRRLGGSYLVVSTNVELRRDGLPYATRGEPSDPGVAVYFLYNKKQMVFACDRWDRVKDNLRAIEKTIEAIRGIERWGASDMMERAYSAFEMLPPPNWRTEFGFAPGDKPSAEEIERRFRDLAKKHHPDHGGDAERFQALKRARDAAKLALAEAQT